MGRYPISAAPPQYKGSGTSVPAPLAKPDLYRNHMELAINKAYDNIPPSPQKEEFKQKALLGLDVEVMAMTQRIQKEQVATGRKNTS